MRVVGGAGLVVAAATVIDISPVEAAPPPNSPPVPETDTYATTPGEPLVVDAPGVLDNDSDPDGDPLTAELILPPQPGTGTVALNTDGSFTYTPPDGYIGSTNFDYAVDDGTERRQFGTVILDVYPANSPPVSANDTYTTSVGTPLVVDAPGVLANDSDPDGDPLTAELLDPAVYGPKSGTVILNSDGSFTYTPAPGYAGGDSFAYLAHDGSTGSNQSNVTIAVEPPANSPPVSVEDRYTTSADTTLVVDAPGVLANDSDPDGDPLTAQLLDQSIWGPYAGTLTFSSDGAFTYTPDPGFVGEDSFAYLARDGTDRWNKSSVIIVIESPANQSPVPADDQVETASGTPATFNVLDNDRDPNGDPLTVQDNSQPLNGTVECDDGGSCTYTPDAGFVGDDAFTYTVSDGVGSDVGTLATAGATVTITVSAAPATTTSQPSPTTSTPSPTTSTPSSIADPTTTVAAPSTTVAAPSTTSAVVVPVTTSTIATTPGGTLPETGNHALPILAIAFLALTAGGVLVVFTSHARTSRP